MPATRCAYDIRVLVVPGGSVPPHTSDHFSPFFLPTMASVEGSTSIQEYAAHLLEVADVVHQSNHQRKVKLDVLTNKSLFDSDRSFALDDSTRSAVDCELTNASAEEGPSVNLPLPEKKKSKSQRISDLKQQVMDCNKALLTLRANADLKHRKLELQLADLKSILESSRNELKKAKAENQKLEKDNQVMEESLQNLVGTGQAEWLKAIKVRNDALEAELHRVKLEREDTFVDSEIMKKAMAACAQCARKLPNRAPSVRHIKGAARQSLWTSFNTALKGLTAEAESTPLPLDRTHRISSLSMAQPPQEDMLAFQEQFDQIKLNHESDMNTIDEQIHNAVEELRSEGSSPLFKSMTRGPVKHHSDKKKSREKCTDEHRNVIGGISSLDSFFMTASKGLSLKSEELDEECSIFSMSRSVATAPDGDMRRKKKKSLRRKKEKSSSNGIHDRRALLSANSNFRQSFRASLIGLGEEVSGAAKANTPKETSSDAAGQL